MLVSSLAMLLQLPLVVHISLDVNFEMLHNDQSHCPLVSSTEVHQAIHALMTESIDTIPFVASSSDVLTASSRYPPLSHCRYVMDNCHMHHSHLDHSPYVIHYADAYSTHPLIPLYGIHTTYM